MDTNGACEIEGNVRRWTVQWALEMPFFSTSSGPRDQCCKQTFPTRIIVDQPFRAVLLCMWAAEGQGGRAVPQRWVGYCVVPPASNAMSFVRPSCGVRKGPVRAGGPRTGAAHQCTGLVRPRS